VAQKLKSVSVQCRTAVTVSVLKLDKRKLLNSVLAAGWLARMGLKINL
jgi:hypothetical protein